MQNHISQFLLGKASVPPYILELSPRGVPSSSEDHPNEASSNDHDSSLSSPKVTWQISKNSTTNSDSMFVVPLKN